MISGALHLLFAPDRVHLPDAVLKGENQLNISFSLENADIKVLEINQTKKTAPSRVVINESPLPDLMCCPGIGEKKARMIIRERQSKPFSDWRDLQDRIKISAIQTQILRDAGVKLNFSKVTTPDL